MVYYTVGVPGTLICVSLDLNCFYLGLTCYASFYFGSTAVLILLNYDFLVRLVFPTEFFGDVAPIVEPL